jgi:integrase
MKFVQPIREVSDINEFKNLLNRGPFGKRNRFLFVLGINSALRVSDMLALKVKDVRDKEHLIVTESKTGKTKRQIINPTLKREIDEYCEDRDSEEWLFPSRKGDKALSRIQAYRILNEVADLMGMEEVGTHTMRKTFAYHYFKKTNNIHILMELLNHSAPSVTLRYIGLTNDTMDEALEDFSL